MEFRLLGPVEARVAGEVVDAGHPRQRAVLAILLLAAGRVVAAEQMIDRVWGEDPPASARNLLSGYVTRLRSAVAGAGGEAGALARQAGGYVLSVDPQRVDLFRFRGLVGDAAAAGDEAAEALLQEALGLWRGPALAGLDSPWLTDVRGTLELERHAAVLELNDVRLRLGRHAALVVELAGQAAAAPGDERLVGQLMLALYRCGRQADALRWFEQTRRYLAEELGADPGPELRALHEQILRADPALALPPPRAAVRSEPVLPIPRELPADVVAFTGREAELAELDALLLGEVHPTAAVISAVSGTAGVGKTALAVHWAHRSAGQFPDGQLHVNLRGYDPDQPVSASDALAGFLRSLGVPGEQIPPEVDQRAARYRSLLSGRTMLIVLDNAATLEQVRPLLPGHRECRVLVTSRDALAGLVARDGARRLDLDLLPLDDAVLLLSELIGARAAAEPIAVTELAELCARLPLALRVAAELAAARPDASLADLVAELADEQRRLHLLHADGDPRTAVRAVFSWSYDSLPDESARAFRLAGLHPGPDFDVDALAALAGLTSAHAGRDLDTLTRAHLVQQVSDGRYGMHDLLRAYARERSAEVDGEQDRRLALTRLFDYYLSVAAAASTTLYPAERPAGADSAQLEAPQRVTDVAAAKEWLDAERATLAAAVLHAASSGWPGHATRLSRVLFRYLVDGGQLASREAIHAAARDAAREIGDPAAEGAALMALGAVTHDQGLYRRAVRYYGQALALLRTAGDRIGEARCLSNLGLSEFSQGLYPSAERRYLQALALFRENDDRLGQARSLNELGIVAEYLGHYEEASDRYREARDLCRDVDERSTEATVVANLAIVEARLGSFQLATDHNLEALALHREFGDLQGEAHVLNNLGVVDHQLGRYGEAADRQRAAITIFRKIGDRAGEAEARNDLGAVLLAAGQLDEARPQFELALTESSQIGNRREQARAHDGLGHCHQAGCDSHVAREHWQQALALFTELGVPEADGVRERLADCSPAESPPRPRGV